MHGPTRSVCGACRHRRKARVALREKDESEEI
jgi:hypothetical protein